ncbi:Aldo keto reductase [Marasmius fiardii PR-910]|nr:Aldo keto reductase [Marasmius fiardii PR-910]
MSKSTRVPLIFGTMILGFAGTDGVRISEPRRCQEVIDMFLRYGHKELDTARAYANGTTEQIMAQLDLKDAVIDTKAHPGSGGGHAPAQLRSSVMTSLRSLGREKVRVLYLHMPDRTIAFEETLEEINKLYQEGRFEIFGLSNYAAWEVAEIVGICKQRGWVPPKIYQGMYNAITRDIEPELLPCARKFGIRVVIYNPLAGGLFAGKVTSAEQDVDGRFNQKGGALAEMYRARYLKSGYFEALEYLKGVVAEHDLSLTEIALRWCQHHSVLTPEDGIVIGASSTEQLEKNCKDSAKGPLPEPVVKALDAAHKMVLSSGDLPRYWR